MFACIKFCGMFEPALRAGVVMVFSELGRRSRLFQAENHKNTRQKSQKNVAEWCIIVSAPSTAATTRKLKTELLTLHERPHFHNLKYEELFCFRFFPLKTPVS
jgi:hypothetical protein